MAAVAKPVVFSWIPKGGGKGGVFSNANSHDADTDMFAIVNEFVIRGGHWTMRAGESVFGTLPGGNFPDNLAIFNSYSSASQTYTSFLMTSYLHPSVVAQHGQGYFTSAGVFTAMDADSPPAVRIFGPTHFQTVKNKCYSATGATRRPGTTTQVVGPRIYYDTVGDGVALTGVNWGLPTPIPNLQVTPDPASYQTGTCTTTTASAVITVMSFDPRVNLAQGMPFYIETAAGSGQYYEFIIASCDSATQLTMTTNWIGTGYAAAKCQGNYGSLTWGQAVPNIATGTATTNATDTITAIAGFDAQATCRVGYRVLIESVAGSQVWNSYIIKTIFSATSVQFTTATVENYAGARIRVDLPSVSSGISTDASYQYCISYFDSARGHIGNPGPIYTVNWGPPFNKRINLLVQNITDAPSAVNSMRNKAWTYDKIILWRTPANGATLQPRVLLNPSGSSQSFSDNLSDDTQLGQVGPVGAGISSKVTAHAPPPDDLNFPTYWEGRFIAASTGTPGVVYWTALAGAEIDFYGVAEECWPPLNNLPIPESDGAITGIRTVGSSCIIETQNALYDFVYNTTNTTSLFRLKRLSSKGQGTYHFATARLPGEDAQSGDILIHFGNDKRLYLLYGEGGDIPISYPVQDVFNTMTPSQVRVGVRHDPDATFIIVQSPTTQGYMYDLDRKCWFSSAMPGGAYVEGLFGGVVRAFIAGGSDVNVYNFMGSAQTGTGAIPVLKTQLVTLPGIPRLDEKEIQAVILYSSVQPSASVTINTEKLSVTCARVDTVTNPFIAAYLDTPDANLYMPQVAYPVKCREFQVQIVFGSGPGSIIDVYEVMALGTHSTDEDSTGGVL